MSQAPLDERTRKAAIRILFITIFLDLLGFGIILPQLPYYAKTCGADGFIVGLVGSSYSLFQFLMSPFWGRLSDRIGRRPIILIGLMGAAISYLVFGAAFRIARFLGISAIPILFLSRSLAGFFNANLATAQAFMADISPGQDRAAAMGLVGAAIGLGFIMGPAFSVVIDKVTHSPESPLSEF
jgi:DHA1 family tetracycline resistance protein-like MFS transporter